MNKMILMFACLSLSVAAFAKSAEENTCACDTCHNAVLTSAKDKTAMKYLLNAGAGYRQYAQVSYQRKCGMPGHGTYDIRFGCPICKAPKFGF